jgi:hypothetical protein
MLKKAHIRSYVGRSNFFPGIIGGNKRCRINNLGNIAIYNIGTSLSTHGGNVAVFIHKLVSEQAIRTSDLEMIDNL